MIVKLFTGLSAVQPGIGTVQGGAPGSNLPPGSQAADFSVTGAGTQMNAPSNVTFHVVVTGTSGNVSATVQPLVSNDGINWSTSLSAITISAGLPPQNGAATTVQNWAYYSAMITAISGTGVSCSCFLNA